MLPNPSPDDESARGFHRHLPWALLAIAGVLLSIPCWTAGLPDADDAATHVGYQLAFDREFWRGEVHPRWLFDLNQGLGSPIFYVQYPLPYVLAAALGRLLFASVGQVDATYTLGLVAAASLVASGFTAYGWLRSLMSRRAALLGALLYLAAPYHLCVDLYGRAALGEMLAFTWIPLCLLGVQHLVARRRRTGVLIVAVSYALLVASHPFSAALLVPLLFAWGLVQCAGRSPRPRPAMLSAEIGAGLLLAAGVSAVYVLPMVSYSTLFDFSALSGANWSFDSHFLSLRGSARGAVLDAMRTGLGSRALKLLGLAAVAVALATWALALRTAVRTRELSRVRAWLAVLAALACLGLAVMFEPLGHVDLRPAFIGRVSAGALSTCALLIVAAPWALARHRGLGWLAIVGGAGSMFLMLQASDWVWQLLHPLQRLQFPWRFGTFLTLAATFAVASAIENLERAAASSIVSAATVKRALLLTVGLVVCGNAVLWQLPSALAHPSRFDAAPPRFDKMLAVYTSPAAAAWLNANEPGALVQAAPAVRVESTIHHPGRVTLTLQTPAETTLTTARLFFPNWRATLDGRPLPLRASEPEHFLSFVVPSGTHTVVLDFTPGVAERAGSWISAVSTAAILLWSLMAWLLERMRTRHSDSFVSTST